ncbi:MAG TPA: nucleotidyltransferase domain-containing protein [Gemmataceae bacterium]|nr:nucleotidyltransferase domain-containing protein [Gemmataceae bacterium]
MTKKLAAAVPAVYPYRYKSPNIPLAAIRRFARQIAKRFQPEKIILFGSYAYGKPHEDSDVDLMVIMPATDSFNQALRIRRAFDRPFIYDLFVRTPNQIQRGLREDEWFICEIMQKGKVLYEASNAHVGAQSRGGLAGSKRTGRSKTATS